MSNSICWTLKSYIKTYAIWHILVYHLLFLSKITLKWVTHFISQFYFHVKMCAFDSPPVPFFFNLLTCIKPLNLWYQYKRLKNHVKLGKATKILSMIFQNIQWILSAGIIVLLLEVSWLSFHWGLIIEHASHRHVH